MPQVVDAELRLEAVSCLAPRDRHYPGVVVEDIDSAERLPGPVGEGPHRPEVGEVQLPDRQRRAGALLEDALALLDGVVDAPARHHDVGASTGEDAGRLESDTAVGAGDDDGPSRTVRYVLGGPLGHTSTLWAGGIPLPSPQQQEPSLPFISPGVSGETPNRGEYRLRICSDWVSGRCSSPPASV